MLPTLDAIVLGVCALVGGLLFARRVPRSARLPAASCALLAGALVAWLGAHYTPAVRAAQPPGPWPQERPAGGYVSSHACQSCHPGEHASWHASYHRTMTQPATPETVRGAFDGKPHVLDGRTYQFERREDEYWVRASGGGEPEVEARLVTVTGSHHLQVYWYPTGQGRSLGQLPYVWLLQDQRWVPRSAAFLRPPEVGNTDESGRWNRACALCHTTDPRPGFDKGIDTEASQMGIACEACHGPGEEHVKLNRDPSRRFFLHMSEDADPSIVNPARLDASRSAQVCGQCHGVSMAKSEKDWRERVLVEGWGYLPGTDLNDNRYVVSKHNEPPPELRPLLTPAYLSALFWSDGSVRVSGREYTALLESPCHTKGEMSCLSCHQLHPPQEDIPEWRDDMLSAAGGDPACISCHEDIDPAAHSRHPAGSSGASCMNCHMPHTTYGLHKAIRDHSVGSPEVASTLRAGRPTACNQCHLDQSLGWTADHLHEWYGHPRPKLSAEQEELSATALWLLTGDAGQRALAAWTLGWDEAQRASGTAWMAPYLGQLLQDPYDVVRIVSLRSLRSLPGHEDFDWDFMAPPADRPAASARVLKSWTPPAARPSLLIQGDGLDRERFDALLERRDDRPMVLDE